MQLHNNGWRIVRDGLGPFILIPPPGHRSPDGTETQPRRLRTNAPWAWAWDPPAPPQRPPWRIPPAPTAPPGAAGLAPPTPAPTAPPDQAWSAQSAPAHAAPPATASSTSAPPGSRYSAAP